MQRFLQKGSLLEPLKIPAFRSLWAASLVSNLGTMMQAVAVAWIITSMTTAPAIVALVPVAASLPGIFVTLPAGVGSDVFGRRRVLALAASWSMIFSLILAVLAWGEMLTPELLLLLLFALGMGNSARIPAWQATVQDVMPKEMVASGVSLNSISFNSARSLGPAVGGLLVALVGAPLVIFLNALSFGGLLFAVRSLRHPPPRTRPSIRELTGSLRQGFLALAGSAPMLWIMARLVSVNFLSACVWAFLPLIGRERLELNATRFGLLLSAIGVAAICAAALAPKLRRLFSVSKLHGGATVLMAAAIAWLGVSSSFLSALFASALFGATVVTCNIHLNVTFQHLAPLVVRGRLLSIYFLGFELGIALGAVVAGFVANFAGVGPTMLWAAVLLVVTLPLSAKIKMSAGVP